MRKILIVIICIVVLTLGFVGCNDKGGEKQVITPAPTFATITFVVSSDLYIMEAPQPMTVAVGSTVNLPLPEDGVAIDIHDRLCWFDDEAFTTPHDDTQPILTDTTVYLFEVGNTYQISYTGLEGFDLEGDYVYSYQYSAAGNTGANLPKATKYGYYNAGLYCIELDGYYTCVPTAAGRDLTFTAPKAIPRNIRYSSGLKGVSMAEIDNPNPTTYDKPEETLVLKPAYYEGKVFDHWTVKVWTTTATFQVDGETITLQKSGTAVTRLSYEMIAWGEANFTLEAQWQ